MTIASEILRLKGNISDAYTACNNKGATLPELKNSANLASCISTISTGGDLVPLDITPKIIEQNFTATAEIDGYCPISVSAVTASIDENIKSENIKAGVSILGVEGEIVSLNGELRVETLTSENGITYTPSAGHNAITSIKVTPKNKDFTITATKDSQEFLVPVDYSGYGTLTVNPVTSGIDENIKPENIKSGVNILGVDGNIYALEGEEQEETLTSPFGNTFTPSPGKNGITSITVTPTNEDRTVDPSMDPQVLNVNQGYSGNGTIIVNPVTSDIDENIAPENIKSGVTILGVAGTIVGLDGEERSVVLTNEEGNTFTPTPGKSGITSITVTPNNEDRILTPYKTERVYTVNSGYSGNGTITVGAVTDDVDDNIAEENIKKGVTILGVTGILETNSFSRDVTPSGEYRIAMPINFNMPNYITKLGKYALVYAFYDCASLTSANMSSVLEIGNRGLYCAFEDCSELTNVDLSSIETVGSSALEDAFQNCTSLSSVDLSSLETVGIYGFNKAFNGCSSLSSISFDSVNEVNGYGFYKAFESCSALTSVSFPALSSTSFGADTNQFDFMLSNVSDCTVHFPSNLQSVIGTWPSVFSGFGGTNTTVLFDLPATS